MLFNSYTFLAFLPIAFAAYWFAGRRGASMQNLILIIASYVFYGWVDWRLCGLMAGSQVTAYFLAKKIESAKGRGWVAIGIIIQLVVLCFFKYYNFFAESINGVTSVFGLGLDIPTLKIIAPVGVSFYSFMIISYLIDIYRGQVKAEKNAMVFFAYMSFFPQLLAGPIGRAPRMLPQFSAGRCLDYDLAADGCRQMLWGYFKKLVIADGCAALTDCLFANPSAYPGSILLLGAFMYAIQIYADFSGYSDLAVGCGKIFGIRLMKNFACPYFSTNIADFWRRWHISLTSWFKDYVYIPLGGSRCSMLKRIRNVFIVFLLSGLWHGADWTFVAWGGLHACFFLPLLVLPWDKSEKSPKGMIENVASWGITSLAVMLAWVLFRANTFNDALVYFSSMFSKSIFVVPRSFLSMMPWIAGCLGFEWLQRRHEHALQISGLPTVFRWLLYLTLAVICIAYKQREAEFIYFQF